MPRATFIGTRRPSNPRIRCAGASPNQSHGDPRPGFSFHTLSVLLQAYANGSEDDREFVQCLALFFTGYLRVHLPLLEKDPAHAILVLEALHILVRISEVREQLEQQWALSHAVAAVSVVRFTIHAPIAPRMCERAVAGRGGECRFLHSLRA